MKPPFPELNCSQSLVLEALRCQESGATAPAPLGPDCGDPDNAPSCVRRHRQTPARDGVPTSLPHLQPARESPRREGSAGHGRAKPPLTTTSPGLPARGRLPATGGHHACQRNPSGHHRGTATCATHHSRAPRAGLAADRAAPRRGEPMCPAGSASIQLLRAGGGRSRGSLGGKG